MCKEYKSYSDPVPDGSAPTDYPTVEDVTDDEDEPEAGPPPKRLCNPPPPGMWLICELYRIISIITEEVYIYGLSQ